VTVDAVPTRTPVRRRLLAAYACGALAAGSGVGLLATSGWLITRASQRPPVLSLSIAIGAVQAFALARGLARYGERLAVHDVALSGLGQMRLRLYDVLEPLVPGGLGRATTGSMLSAFVADTEAVATAAARRLIASVDLAASASLGVGLAMLIDRRVAVVLAAGVAAATVLALAVSRLDARAAGREAAVRAEVADAVVEAAGSAAELAAYGRADLVAGRLDELARRSRSIALRRSLASGLGRAVAVCAGAATLVAVAVTGLSEHDVHRLSGVALAVVVFDALAVLEACGALPDALAGAQAGRAAAARLDELAALDPPTVEPPVLSPAPSRPAGAALESATVRARDGSTLLDQVDLQIPPPGTSRSSDRAEPGRRPASTRCCTSSPATPDAPSSAGGTSPRSDAAPWPQRWAGSRRIRTSSPIRSRRTWRSPTRTPGRTASSRCCAGSGSATGSTRSLKVSRRGSASEAGH